MTDHDAVLLDLHIDIANAFADDRYRLNQQWAGNAPSTHASHWTVGVTYEEALRIESELRRLWGIEAAARGVVENPRLDAGHAARWHRLAAALAKEAS